jgi:hypothetical protein
MSWAVEALIFREEAISDIDQSTMLAFHSIFNLCNNICFLYIYIMWVSGFVRTSTNFTGPEINDHINFQ